MYLKYHFELMFQSLFKRDYHYNLLRFLIIYNLQLLYVFFNKNSNLIHCILYIEFFSKNLIFILNKIHIFP